MNFCGWGWGFGIGLKLRVDIYGMGVSLVFWWIFNEGLGYKSEFGDFGAFLAFVVELLLAFSLAFPFPFPLKRKFLLPIPPISVLLPINPLNILLRNLQKPLTLPSNPPLTNPLKLIPIPLKLIFLSLLPHQFRIKQAHARIILDTFFKSPSLLIFVLLFYGVTPAD